MRDELVYWPVARRFIPVLALVFVAVLAAVEVGIVGFAYERLGLGRYWVYAALTAPIIGSRVNLPVARTRAEIEECSGSGRSHSYPGTVGTLVGADLLNLWRVRTLGAPVVLTVGVAHST